jgi:hypothetical protein
VGALTLAICTCTPRTAAADWLFTPFYGFKFDGQTNLVDLDQGTGRLRMTIGGSAALLGNGPFGVEVDFSYTPGFFQSGASGGLIASSNALTLMGNVLIAAPTQLTRESLRPYVVAGAGLMHVGIRDVLDLLQVNTNFVGLDIGGGAIGQLTKRTSLRFEIRRFQNLGEKNTGSTISFGPSRLRFLRADVGLTFRY